MDALRIERDDDVLRIVLARPETRNALDAAVIAELAEAFVDVGKARAVVLVGEGQSFCAGADIEWMRQSVSLTPDENVADANALANLCVPHRPLQHGEVSRRHGAKRDGDQGALAIGGQEDCLAAHLLSPNPYPWGARVTRHKETPREPRKAL